MSKHPSRAARLAPWLATLVALAGCAAGAPASSSFRPGMTLDAVGRIAPPAIPNLGVFVSDALHAAPQAAHPGELTIALSGDAIARMAAARHVMATVADIEYITVLVQPVGYAEVSQTVPKASLVAGTGSVTFTGLPPVNAKVTISAFDISNTQIGTSAQNIVISALAPTVVNFNIQLNPTYVLPNGGLTTDVSFTDGVTIVGTPPPGAVPTSGKTLLTLPISMNPEAVKVDAAGRIWVTAFATDRIYRFTSSGASIDIISLAGLSRPTALDFDAAGNAWVADFQSGKVEQIKADGTKGTSFAVGPYPTDVKVDALGNLWVVCYYTATVLKYTPTGTLVGFAKIGTGTTALTMSYPISMALDALGNAYVVGLKSRDVTKLSPLGLPIATFPVGAEPEGIAIDANGNLWVTNNAAATVTKMTSAGVLIGTYATGNRPRGVAIDKLGNAWIANTFDNTISKISPTGTKLGTFAIGKGPRNVAVDGGGNIWVTNYDGNSLMKLAP